MLPPSHGRAAKIRRLVVSGHYGRKQVQQNATPDSACYIYIAARVSVTACMLRRTAFMCGRYDNLIAVEAYQLRREHSALALNTLSAQISSPHVGGQCPDQQAMASFRPF